MNQDERTLVGENWYGLAQMYGREIPRTALKLMLDSVNDLPAHAIIHAFNHWAKTSKQNRHPMPSEIREIVCPEENVSAEAQAREIASRICGAIPKYGWCNSRSAMEFIGQIGWRIVERCGGWQYLCEHMGVDINPTTFQAQIRDQIAANIQYGMPALERKIHALPTASNDLMQISDIIKPLLLSKTVKPDEGPKESEP